MTDSTVTLKPEDIILRRRAELFQNLGTDSTPEERELAKSREKVLLSKLYEINPELAERCGFKKEKESE